MHQRRLCLFNINQQQTIHSRGKIPQLDNGGDISISDGRPVGCRLHRAQQQWVHRVHGVQLFQDMLNILKSLCFHQAVRFQYIKHILEELYPVYSVHPLLLYSVKTTTNRASITYNISSVIKLWKLPKSKDLFADDYLSRTGPGACEP